MSQAILEQLAALRGMAVGIIAVVDGLAAAVTGAQEQAQADPGDECPKGGPGHLWIDARTMTNPTRRICAACERIDQGSPMGLEEARNG